MKTIGLIGGMSWESTAEYYRMINETVHERLGEVHSAQILMYSFDFQEIEASQTKGEWALLTDRMVETAEKLKQAGADFIVICANTMHIMAPDIEKRVNIKVLHIVDVTAEAIKKAGLKKVALLGTIYTMKKPFFKDRLKNLHHIDVMIPNDEDCDTINRIIYKELVVGDIRESSKKQYLRIIEKLKNEGAEGVILGCTEIPLLIKQEDTTLPVFDTTALHALFAADLSLNK